MDLYKFDWGPFPRRVLIYLREKGITSIDMIDVDVIGGENRGPEFLAINPAATVPVLKTDTGTLIRQSSSIVEYLEQIFPAPPLLGSNSEERAQIGDLVRVVDEAYSANLYSTFYGSPIMKMRREPSIEVARAMRSEAIRALGILEQMAGDGPFLRGGSISYADIALFASEQFYRAVYRLRIPPDLSRLNAAYEAFAERPSVLPLPVPQEVSDLAPIEDLEAAF